MWEFLLVLSFRIVAHISSQGQMWQNVPWDKITFIVVKGDTYNLLNERLINPLRAGTELSRFN